MIIAVIGSRGITDLNLEEILPPVEEISELCSGAAKGVDTLAREFAQRHAIPIKEFLPDYARFGKSAPLKRNIQIVDYSEKIYACWDGKSRGTKYVIDYCAKVGKPCEVVHIDK
jgi:hypothetical protein